MKLHQPPDIASQYFDNRSSRQLLDLAKDITIAYRTELKDTQQLQNAPIAWPRAPVIFARNWEPGYREILRELCQPTRVSNGIFYCWMIRWSFCYDVAKLSLGRSALLDAAFERAIIPFTAETLKRDQSAGIRPPHLAPFHPRADAAHRGDKFKAG